MIVILQTQTDGEIEDSVDLNEHEWKMIHDLKKKFRDTSAKVIEEVIILFKGIEN